MSRRRSLLLQAAAGGGGFDPLSYGSPFHAFWAENPNQSLSGEVTSWTNEGSNGTAATGSSGAVPTYSATAINSRPALDFDGTNDHLLISAASTDDVAFGGTYVAVVQLDTVAAVNTILDGDGLTKRWLLRVDTTPEWDHFTTGGAINIIGGGAASAGTPYVVVSVFGSATQAVTCRVNGTAVLTDATVVNIQPLDGLTIGRQSSVANYLNGKIAFAAVYPSNILGESWFSEFESGLIDLYGA